MTIKENSLDIMRSKLEKYQSLDFLNEGLIEHLEKKIIVHKKLFIEYRQEIDDLKAELSKFQSGNAKKYVDKLKAEIKQLKADAKHDADVCYDVDDEHVKIIKALEEQVDDLMIDKDRLMKQVSSNRGNSSSTHTHTIGSVKCSIAREIAEYMYNNDTCKDARMFLLPIESFDGNGIYDANYGDVYYKDGME